MKYLRKCGKRDNIGTNYVTLSPIAIVSPSAEQQMEIVSSSANDTDGGSGAQKVTIEYLDSNFDEHSEEITMNGTTAVTTKATNIYRINRMYVSAGATADGNITLRDVGGGGNDRYYIEAGDSEDKIAYYTIPKNYNGYIWAFGVGAESDNITFSLCVRSGNIRTIIDIKKISNNYEKSNVVGVENFNPGDSVFIMAKGLSGGGNAVGCFELRLLSW